MQPIAGWLVVVEVKFNKEYLKFQNCFQCFVLPQQLMEQFIEQLVLIFLKNVNLSKVVVKQGMLN
jgi:prolipoprotein diacylglyceryltransferase